MKKIVPAIIAALMFSITAYAAFSPISTASWHSNFSKVEVVEENTLTPGYEVIVSEAFRLSDYVDLVEEDESDGPSDEVVNDIGLDTEAENSMNITASYDEDSARVIDIATYGEEVDKE